MIMIQLFCIFSLLVTIAICVQDDIFDWLKDDDNIISSKDLAIMRDAQKEQQQEIRSHSSVHSEHLDHLPSLIQSSKVETSTNKGRTGLQKKSRKIGKLDVAEYNRKYRIERKLKVSMRKERMYAIPRCYNFVRF